MPDNTELLALAREIEGHQVGFVAAISAYLDPSEQWKKEQSYAEAGGHLNAYNDARRRLRLLVADTPILKLPGHEHAKERGFLNAVLLNESLVDRFLSEAGARNPLDFDIEELEPLAEEYLAWFSHYEYARARLEGAVLVLNAGVLPDDFQEFVSEIQECFAFERYTAVCALCRTTLESGLLRVYAANQLDDRESANSKAVKDLVERNVEDKGLRKALTSRSNLFFSGTLDDERPTIFQMSERLCWLPAYRDAEAGDEPLREVLARVRKQGNDLIHAKWAGDYKAAKSLMTDLFRALHLLFELKPEKSQGYA